MGSGTTTGGGGGLVGSGGFENLTFHCDTMGRLIPPRVPWSKSWPSKAPRPPFSVCHPQLWFHHHMEQETLKSLFGDLLNPQEDRLVWLLCLCSCFCVR